MATLLYMTRGRAPAGAPTSSRFAEGEGDNFTGSYMGDLSQAVDGMQLTNVNPIPSYGMTSNPLWAGGRSSVGVNSNEAMMPVLPNGGGVGGYYFAENWSSLAVFSIILNGAQTVSGGDILTAGFGQVLELAGWGGKFSFYDDTIGPGQCGILPRAIYIWRPSTQSLVGNLAIATNALHRWTLTFDWGTNAAAAYLGAGASFPNHHGSYISDTNGFPDNIWSVDAQDGDLLCVEWWVGRTIGPGEWTFNAWDKQQWPNSVDGSRKYSTVYLMPVGYGPEPTLYANQEVSATSVNTLRSTQTLSFRENAPRSPQASISVSP